jgi:hypothetical protein
VLTREAHGSLFDDLEWGAALFKILPVTKDSPAPASDYDPTRTVVRVPGDLPPNADALPNPFYAMANVRLRKVRVWMVGMSTGAKRHYVQLVHTGEERFRTPRDQPYPVPVNSDDAPAEPAYVTHDSRPITFVYDSTGLAFDAATQTLTPGSLRGSTPALEDGDLRLRIDRGAELPLQCQFAPIGPFGKWRLIIDPIYNDNEKLSLKKLDMIVIHFHGVHQNFT